MAPNVPIGGELIQSFSSCSVSENCSHNCTSKISDVKAFFNVSICVPVEPSKNWLLCFCVYVNVLVKRIDVGIERHCSQPRPACPGLDQKRADDDVSGAAQLKILELPCTAQHIRLRSKVSMCSDTDNLFFTSSESQKWGI